MVFLFASGLEAKAASLTWLSGTGDWTTGSNWTGGIAATASGTAIITNGGTAQLLAGASGTYSELHLGTASGQAGTINIVGGYLTGTSARLGQNGGAGTANVTSGTWSNSFVLYVGSSGTGSLQISGGLVSSANGIIGHDSGTGSATVTGGTWNSSYMYVGYSAGTGSLLVNGGLVSTDTASFIGRDDGTGSATVSSGTWRTTNDLYVGTFGTGSLLVNGGYVSNFTGYIGYREGGPSNATVSSGTWRNGAYLIVGEYGTGSLLVNGGLVSSNMGVLGNRDGGDGSATVSSGTWNISSVLYVGVTSGTGSLLVNGGLVFDNFGVIGVDSGTGSVTVSSGTWSHFSGMSVGETGMGSLLVNGGLVSVTGTTVTGYYARGEGTITLSGSSGNRGMLSTSRVMELSGTGTLNFDGGILQAKANESDFISGFEAGDVTIGTGGAFIDSNNHAIGINTVLSGSGGLTKLGAGTLTLTGSNSYEGGTTVEAGALLVNNANGSGTGTGGVTVNGGLLGGTGTIDGTVTVNSGGLLAPGASIGTLTTGSVILIDEATFGAELNTATELSDLLVVNGNLTIDLDSTVVLSLTDLGGNQLLDAGTLFTLIDYSGVWNGGTFAGLADDALFTLGANNYQISYNGLDGGTSAVTLLVVPEPSSALLVSGFLVFVLARRRRD